MDGWAANIQDGSGAYPRMSIAGISMLSRWQSVREFNLFSSPSDSTGAGTGGEPSILFGAEEGQERHIIHVGIRTVAIALHRFLLLCCLLAQQPTTSPVKDLHNVVVGGTMTMIARC